VRTAIQLVDREYTILSHIDKYEDGSTFMSLEVRDFLDTVVDSAVYDFSSNSTVTQTEKHVFKCPTEVFIDNLDFDGCSKFFDTYFTKAEPLAMVLAKDNSESRATLTDCQGKLIALNSQMKDYQDQYQDCYTKLGFEREKVANAANDTAQTIAKKDVEMAIFESQHVGVWWQWAAMIEFAVLILIGIVSIFGGTEVN
jgi:hypothetical protein